MKQNELSKPFFAQFLEAQARVQQQSEANSLIWPPVSLPIIEHDQTMKYPSDGDDEYPSS